jgi:hypothetical protein
MVIMLYRFQLLHMLLRCLDIRDDRVLQNALYVMRLLRGNKACFILLNSALRLVIDSLGISGEVRIGDPLSGKKHVLTVCAMQGVSHLLMA